MNKFEDREKSFEKKFQIGDLLGNILGVIVAYSLVKIYLFLDKT